jgi:predicted CoA-binding protein
MSLGAGALQTPAITAEANAVRNQGKLDSMIKRDLSGLFAPKSIAVVGATDRVGSVGADLFRNLVFGHFQGVVYPINTRASQVLAIKTSPSLTALDEQVDLAVMIVPPKAVLSAMEECGALGIKNAIVISAGFKEIGGDGVVLEKQLKATALKYGINVMGPNCLGLMPGLCRKPGTWRSFLKAERYARRFLIMLLPKTFGFRNSFRSVTKPTSPS